jgi:DNA repair protein RadD
MTLPATGKITPRDYQQDAYSAIAQAIREYTGPVFIEASVGAGKTIIMGMVLARVREMNRTAMVLARAGELVEQNAQTFWDCEVKNSIFSASLGIKSTHYPVIVGTEGTVVNALDEGKELAEYKCDFLLIDENHEVNFEEESSQYMQIINTLLERNPKLRIIGLTGTPYRGANSIVGKFWKKCAYKIDANYLVGLGFLVPDLFGLGDDGEIKYDLSKWHANGDEGATDYTNAELGEMEAEILENEEMTRDIVAKVLAHTESRNCVLITGAGLKHLQQIAKYLPPSSWGIITSEHCGTTEGDGKRRDILKAAYDGKIKYLLQVGCLTTGVDIPLIDTSVIMRKIASLRILVQLLGRGKRLLKDFQVEAGYVKHDHLILDYTETFMEMHELYENPVLEAAALQVAKKTEVELIDCPVCAMKNSPRARRCVGQGEHTALSYPVEMVTGNAIGNFSIDGRCEFFWSFNACKKCHTPNDAMARECRKCGCTLKDPNANLIGKHYTDEDWRDVHSMTMQLTKDKKGVVVRYLLIGEPQEGAKTWDLAGVKYEQATEIFFPEKREKWALATWHKFIAAHMHKDWHQRVKGKGAICVINSKAMFDTPARITHRVNADGNSRIHRKEFLSGRQTQIA